MKVNTKWQGNISFESTADVSGHTVNMMQESGATAAHIHRWRWCCTAWPAAGIDLCVIMRHHMDNVEDLELELDGERAETEPKRFTDIEITVKLTGCP